jgi:hypothetical protein
MRLPKALQQRDVPFKPWHGLLFLGVIVVSLVLGFLQWQSGAWVEESPGSSEVILLQSSCEAAGGVWNECISPCRGDDSDFCIDLCSTGCECVSTLDCPFGSICTDMIDGIGVCSNS